MSEAIERYQVNNIAKISLKEVTEHFKGKAVSKLSSEGNISVVNLSDMLEIGINYDGLKKLKQMRIACSVTYCKKVTF